MIPIRDSKESEHIRDPKIHFGEHVKSDYYWFRYRKKNGELGALYNEWVYYTPLYECELCKKLGVPKIVNRKSDIIFWDWWICPYLCLGCWNRVKRFIYQKEQIKEIRLLIRRLRSEANE